MNLLKKGSFITAAFLALFCILNLSLLHLSAIEAISLFSFLILSWLFGVVAYPLTLKAIPHLGVASYALAKVLGGAIFFYILWLLNHIDFLRGPWTSTLLLLGFIVFFFKYVQEKLSELLLTSVKEVVGIEFLFITIFFLVLSLYAFHPELYWGEKPMDFNLLNFFARYPSLPPQDPWFSGELMHYYYWGYFYLANLSNMSGLSLEIAYGAGVALSASLFGCALFSLFSLSLRRCRHRIGAVLLLLFSSNLAAFLFFFSEETKGNMNFFWSTTRLFSQGAFAEFPIWSFLFADLHAHVLSYPFATMFLCLAIYGIKYIWKSFDFKESIFFVIIYSFSFGLLILINGWDFVIYSLLVSLLWLFQGLRYWKKPYYWISFLFSHLAGLVFALPIFFTLLGGTPKRLSLSNVDMNDFQSFFFFFGGWGIIIALSASIIISVKRTKTKVQSVPLVSLLMATLVLTFMAENIVFMDRFNTIFKTYTNVFIWLGVVALTWFFWLLENGRRKIVFVLMITCVLSIQLIGTVFISNSILNSRVYGRIGTGLKGSEYLKRFKNEDYQIIEWLRTKTVGLPTILERDSRSFDHSAARISMHTGLPSYLGWHNHVRLRGASDLKIKERRALINFIYNSSDALKVHEQVQKAGIQFIVLGKFERGRLSREALMKFESFSQLFRPLLKVNNRVVLFGVGDYEPYLRSDKIKIKENNE